MLRTVSQDDVKSVENQNQIDNNDSDRHIFVDELMKLRVLYEQYLFNYCVKQSELDKRLAEIELLPPPTSVSVSVLQNSKSIIFKDTPLPPPTIPHNKSHNKSPKVRRKLSKQTKVTSELDAMVKHGLVNKTTKNNTKSAVHFTFDDDDEECMSMRVLVNMGELKLSLCENRQLPFCQFSINGFNTEWNRQHNGNHDTYLTINAIQLKKISGKGSKQQQYTQMLCPFDQIQMLKKASNVANNSSSSSSLSPLSIAEMRFKDKDKDKEQEQEEKQQQRPEVIFKYYSKQNGNTSTKLIVNEPCGFLLPSVIKRLQEFFNVTSDSEMINISTGTEEIQQAEEFIANWTSNTEFTLNNGKFICLENPNIINTNAVVLNVTLTIRKGSVPNISEFENKCVIHSNMDVNIESLNALICPANQIIDVGERGGVRMHTIIEQQRLKCLISGEEHISMINKNEIIYKDMDINGKLNKIDFTISFIDMQIFENILNSIKNTFNPTNQTPLSERIQLLIPIENGLRDNYFKLRTQGYEPELCFEALMKYNDLQRAASYCMDYNKSFDIRKNRGDINKLIDLLPSNMYHNFRELNGRYNEKDIIRALIISDNQLDKATIILNQSTADSHPSYSSGNKPIIDDQKMNDTYFNNSIGSNIDYTADDEDDDDDEYDYNDKRIIKQVNGNRNRNRNNQPIKIKINLAFESEKGIEINLINDVMSSSAMPFVGIKLYSMHLVWTKDIERTKGTFTFDIQSKYYNPMIVTMEPLLESSRIQINWNSMPSSSTKSNINLESLYTIKANFTGIPHERSALVPKIIPVNINITHIFGKTLLETLHSWSHFAATRRNRIITAWKPFYIVNKTGELLSVWPSQEKDRQQEILPMEIQALSLRGGVRAAFTGRLLKYNRLEISFRVGNVASFEQISVFQNRRRKIMHKKHKVCVVLHTVFRKGSKFVYIWSPTEIRNHTARPLRIKLYFDKKTALRVPKFDYLQTKNETKNDDDPEIITDNYNHNNNLQCIDFGIIEPGSSIPVPLSIKSLESYISFKPTTNDGWNYTKLQKIRDLIKTNKFTLIKSKWKHGYSNDTKPFEKIESFFLRPRYHRDLITIIIQSPLIITNLFPFPIRIQIKLKNNNSHNRIYEKRIFSYESLPVTTDFEWQNRREILIGIWLPGYGQSEWVKLPFGDNYEPIQIQINHLIIYLSNRACKSVPFFRDDAPATLAMNMLYLYTKYLFINKTGLELEIRSPKQNLSIKQMEVEIEIFENQRKNVHNKWVKPFEPLDIPSECDRTYRPRSKNNIVLPNKKWKWKSDWKVSDWEYAKDFNYSFHSEHNIKNNNEMKVRRRKWSRIRIPNNKKMLGTISCFGGASTKINNKICCRILDKNHRTDWSQYIPLTEAVTNMVLSIKSLANHKVFFDIAVIFELHRLYPSIKVIKFYPRFVGLNACTFIQELYIRPCYIEHALQQTIRNNKPNPDRYKYDDGISKPPIIKTKRNNSIRNNKSIHRLHLNRRNNQHSQPLLIDDIKRDERILYQSTNNNGNVTDGFELLYSTPLHWFNISQTRYIQASIDGKEWSTPFPIHEITQFPIRIVNKHDTNNGFSIIRVQSRTIGQTTIVIFKDERKDYPFFQIHNQTKYNIYYAQNISLLNKNISNKFYLIKSSFAQSYAWDNLLIAKKRRKLVIKIRDKQFCKPISFDSNGFIGLFNIERTKESVYIQIQNRGATKVLTISENVLQEKDYENESNIDLNIRIDSFGISLIDELPSELLYIAGNKLQFNLLLSENEQRIRFTIDSFQIDNQMINAISNVLFVGLPVMKSKTNKKLPWLDFQLNLCTQNLSQSSDSKYIQALNVRPQKFSLSLDGATLQKLINFFYVFTSINSYQKSNDSSTKNHNPNHNEPQPMYFGQLFLAPMEFIVSFRDLEDTFGGGNDGNNDGDRVNSSNVSNNNYDEYAILNSSTKQHLQPLLNSSSGSGNNSDATNVPLLHDIMFQFGVVVVNFDCAVIRVSGYAERDRVFDSKTLINRLSSHYSGELLRGFFNIIGSLEILGNIAGLTNSVRSGLQDFWFEPQNGTTPGEVFKGFGKGTYSLLQQSIQGITHSVSSLTSALGTGLAYASGDTDFAKQRSMLKGKQSSKPKNMADGIFKGGKKLASHTWDGISGIWKDPIQGGQEDGVKGAIAGFGQGVMGLVCKPLVGVMDLGSDLVSGIGNTLPSVTNNNILINVNRKRKTRMFYSKMNIMKEYKYSDALIKENLNRIRTEFNNSNNNNNNTDNEQKNNNTNNEYNKYLSNISFEGSFETEPNHNHELFIILGNGLLLCRWSQTKQNKLKFVNFYPWKTFFSISNRPGKKILICTFKLQSRYHHRQLTNNISTSANIYESQLSLPNNLSYIDSNSYKTQKDLRLPLKSAKLAEIIAKKLSQYIRASQRQ